MVTFQKIWLSILSQVKLTFHLQLHLRSKIPSYAYVPRYANVPKHMVTFKKIRSKLRSYSATLIQSKILLGSSYAIIKRYAFNPE